MPAHAALAAMVISSSRPGTIAAAPDLAFAVSFIVVVTAAAVAFASSSSYASSLSAQRTPTSIAARFVAVAGSEAVGLRLCVLAASAPSPVPSRSRSRATAAKRVAFASVVFCTVLGVFGVTPVAGFCADLGGLPGSLLDHVRVPLSKGRLEAGLHSGRDGLLGHLRRPDRGRGHKILDASFASALGVAALRATGLCRELGHRRPSQSDSRRVALHVCFFPMRAPYASVSESKSNQRGLAVKLRAQSPSARVGAASRDAGFLLFERARSVLGKDGGNPYTVRKSVARKFKIWKRTGKLWDTLTIRRPSDRIGFGRSSSGKSQNYVGSSSVAMYALALVFKNVQLSCSGHQTPTRPHISLSPSRSPSPRAAIGARLEVPHVVQGELRRGDPLQGESTAFAFTCQPLNSSVKW